MCGYLDRNGKFYECLPWGHGGLARQLFPKHRNAERYIEENLGWCRQGGDLTWSHVSKKHEFPSKKQWNFIFDDCAARKKNFPPRYLDFDWEDYNHSIGS
jgi:hypothetical protein